MKNKIDLRIIKTNKVLFEALITLMEQKDFEKIKISDICDQALINRSTFYAHYEDKYDLLLAMINDLKNNLENELKKNKEEDISKNYFMELLRILINHVDEKRETYNSILKNDKNGIVMDFLIDVSYRDLTSRLKNNNIISVIPVDVITKFYIGGIVNIGIDWVKNKDKYTLYVLNVDDYDHSKTASNVYNYVKDNFNTAGMSGSIYDENKPILQLWDSSCWNSLCNGYTDNA